MELTKEVLEQYATTKNAIHTWLGTFLDRFCVESELSRGSYKETITNISVDIKNQDLDVETTCRACGGGCCGDETHYYSIPLKYIYDIEYRKSYREERLKSIEQKRILAEKLKAEEELKAKKEEEEWVRSSYEALKARFEEEDNEAQKTS